MSPELARENPELFRAKLLDSIKRETAVGGAIWDTAVRRGITSPRQMTLDTSTWISQTSLVTGDIKLGTASMGEAARERLIFEDRGFRGEREYTYRAMHEITHLLHPKLFGALSYEGRTRDSKSVGVYNTLLDMRKSGLGLSALGSLDFYQKASDKATEDHVELMNMFTIDPAYLERYLAFLSDPNYSSFRQENKLITLDVSTAKHLLKEVKHSLEFFLDDTNE